MSFEKDNLRDVWFGSVTDEELLEEFHSIQQVQLHVMRMVEENNSEETRSDIDDISDKLWSIIEDLWG